MKCIGTKISPSSNPGICFIHQLYNLLIAYKVTYPRFANIQEVARAAQTDRIFWADSPRRWVSWPLPGFLKGAPESNVKAAWELWEWSGPPAFLSFLFMSMAVIFLKIRNQRMAGVWGTYRM